MVIQNPFHRVLVDLRGRLVWYKDDWREGMQCGVRVLAPTVFIFLASTLPALAFGQQLSQETDGVLSVVQVLAATAITGTMQAVIGGQPLLIVGVAEPIVLTYGFMYSFARDQSGLGTALFLPWAGWVCVWTSIMCLGLALAGTCALIDKFTRTSGELFGFLVATVLFAQAGIKGAIAEFSPVAGAPPGAANDTSWVTANGIWALLLAAGVLLTSLEIRRARQWRFGTERVRTFLADYGVAIMVVAWSGLSFALRGAPDGIPRRVDTPNSWQATSGWSVAASMSLVPAPYIAAALVPAFIISVLLYFDHNISSKMAQAREFNLVKPPAYHYDFVLLATMTLLCGLLGLPPVNGVLPQAPMHSRSLATCKAQVLRARARAAGANGKSAAGARSNSAVVSLEVSCHKPNGLRVDAANGANGAATVVHIPMDVADDKLRNGQREGGPAVVLANDPPLSAPRGHVQQQDREAVGDGYPEEAHAPVQVAEQRVSGLLQSLMVAACLGATPAIKQIPTGVLWGYFLFMAFENVTDNQFWARLLLLFTDRTQYRRVAHEHGSYLTTVPFPVIARFTVLQLAYTMAIWALVTWAGIAGIAFPLPIMALVPLRLYVLPRLFRPEYLEALDPLRQEDNRQQAAHAQPTSSAVASLGHAEAAGDVGSVRDKGTAAHVLYDGRTPEPDRFNGGLELQQVAHHRTIPRVL